MHVCIFIGVRKKVTSVHYIHLTTANVKMLYYDKINVLKGIDTNKSNKSKEYIICHVFFRIVTINMSQRYRMAAI